MKRNLLAASVLCTLTVCGAAQAADIEVYGLIDVALGYAHKDDGEETTSDFQMPLSNLLSSIIPSASKRAKNRRKSA